MVVVVSPIMLALLAPLSVAYYYLQVCFCFGAEALCMQACAAASGPAAWLHAAAQHMGSRPATAVRAAADVPPQTRYVRSSREIKRLDSLALSPIFSLFSETLQASGPAAAAVAAPYVMAAPYVNPALPLLRTACACQGSAAALPRLRLLSACVLPPRLWPIIALFLQGLVTVRAFRQQAPFEQRNGQLLDGSNRAWWPAQVRGGGLPSLPRLLVAAPVKTIWHPTPALCHAQCVNRWLSVRLELLGITVVFCTALLVGVALPRDAGLAGLAITSALNLTGLMNWMVRQTTELEVNMNRQASHLVVALEQPGPAGAGQQGPPMAAAGQAKRDTSLSEAGKPLIGCTHTAPSVQRRAPD